MDNDPTHADQQQLLRDLRAEGLIRSRAFTRLYHRHRPTLSAALKRMAPDDYITINADLTQGRWVVVLYMATCPVCREAIPQYEEIAARWETEPDMPTLALIEVPPYAPDEEDPVSPHAPVTRGLLSNKIDWHIRVPNAFDVRDGTIMAVPSEWLSDGKQSATGMSNSLHSRKEEHMT